MIIALLAALSLASSMSTAATVDVPYLSQTDALCGGAAAAMIFRYWGDTHADVEQFGSLVDRRAGGIATDVLTQAIAARGWKTDRFQGSLADLRARLTAGQPVIVLISDRGARYHYVVVTGIGEGSVTIHDPSWGPSRTIAEQAFVRRWGASQFWSLVVLPTANVHHKVVPSVPESRSLAIARDGCDALLDRALDDIAANGWGRADQVLDAVRAECPLAAAPLRELAGLRFAQQRWNDASTLARAALSLKSDDAYALDLLGSSLFMQDDTPGALKAWNQIGKPQVDLVRIEGVHHSRHQAISEALDLHPNARLTSDAFMRATRRLGELPDRSAARLAIRPEADGFAAVDVVITERAVLPATGFEWAAAGARAGVDREMSIAVPGSTGQGDIWAGSWRWWSNRPKGALTFVVPRPGGVFGVWQVDGSWEAETYNRRPDAEAAVVRETHSHGGLTVSDWLSANVRYAVSAGYDAWSAGQHAASMGVSIERRWLADRIALSGDARTWIATSGGSGFSAVGARVIVHSSTGIRRWSFGATLGGESVSDNAPLILWPGAGEGRARQTLLRAHPLILDGVIDLSSESIFGRTLTYANVGMERWLDRPKLVRFAIAAFADFAGARRRILGNDRMQADVGGGLRFRVPGAEQTLRVDFAHGLRDASNAITVGWIH